VERAGQPFDLAVIDCAMPDMPGRAVYDHLRRASPLTRTLFVSGYARDALDGLRPAVAWGFLAKPFGAEELVTAVQRLLTAESGAEWDGSPAADASRG
jgi:two-component system cell cycle sensor histidine kinase/response regulator CckA